MAIARGAGTEIIRTVHLEGVQSSDRNIIFGVQHHIYTVLSIICYAKTLATDKNWVRVYIKGYDAVAGTTNRDLFIFQSDMSLDETFVWNDKFSFNGTEPTDHAGLIDDAIKQNAHADQGSSVAQRLRVKGEASGDSFHVTCTYIDQNNA